MLAGVLLGLCTQPFHDIREAPWAIGCMLLGWAALQRFAPRWAVPGTLLIAAAAVILSGSLGHVHMADGALPRLAPTVPGWSASAAVSIAVPLYLVTMTSQNIPGVAVMRSLGYEVPWRASLVYTGAATAAGAALGAHAINLSAIAAALAAGPEAGADRSRRWIAAVTAGITYVALGCASPVVVAVALAAPPGVVPAFAGIALLTALGGALTQALGGATPLPAVVTLAVAASGLTLGGIAAPFWALLAGCALHLLTRPRPAGDQAPT
jgi:benzoate membrane transport protein